MALRKARPMRFVPEGLSDALDGTDVFQGACSILQNVIPDENTKGLWVPRPGAVSLTTFAGFTTPGFISAAFITGTRVYGMIASGLNVGHDEPFCYDLNAGTFVTITGITAANTPVSPTTSGTWEPPTMDLVGTKLIVTHPGFNFAGGYAFGWFETSNPGAVTWSAGNTTTNLLPARPSSVTQFGQRAWFLVNPVTGQPGAYFTDILLLSVTNASQVLTFGDNKQLTAAVGLPLENQLGGIIQSLIVFKGSTNAFQVTGDLATSTLAVNAMNVATGTVAPRSLTVTPKGAAFVSPDGVRIIDFNARISDPIGVEGAGVNSPFINALYPTRICAGSNANTYRVTVQDSSKVGTPTYEYWYDIVKNKWSGPHTFPADIMLPYGNTFIMVPRGITGSLWQSDVINAGAASATENGATLSCIIQTSLLPDTQDMSENCVVETAIEMTLPLSPGAVLVTPLDETQGAIIPAVSLSIAGTPSYWGAAIWGSSLWMGSAQYYRSVRVPWTAPVVFKRMYINMAFNAATNVRVGAINLKYQQLGYMQQ